MTKVYEKNLRPWALARAVACWLEFELRCGRKTLFGERYIAVPIGQFLLGNAEDPVVAEPQLPPLQRPSQGGSAAGRPRAADFAILKKGEFGAPTYVLETKLTKNGRRPTKTEIVEDVFRLAMLRENGAEICWFVVAGQQRFIEARLFNSSFSLSGKGEPSSSLVFPRLKKPKTKTTLIHRGVALAAVKKFNKSYSGSLPDRLALRMVGQWPPAPNEKGLMCCVWEVSLVAGRRHAPQTGSVKA